MTAFVHFRILDVPSACHICRGHAEREYTCATTQDEALTLPHVVLCTACRTHSRGHRFLKAVYLSMLDARAALMPAGGA